MIVLARSTSPPSRWTGASPRRCAAIERVTRISAPSRVPAEARLAELVADTPEGKPR
jgi:hypothetical protein